MRLWSLHPSYLDCKGLLAVWREALLAKKVLLGRTKGYKNHSQLDRFKNSKDPIASIDTYLFHIFEESRRRCYKFDGNKIGKKRAKEKIEVTLGQVIYEFSLLKKKLNKRDPKKLEEIKDLKKPKTNPLFIVVEGPIEKWEKV